MEHLIFEGGWAITKKEIEQGFKIERKTHARTKCQNNYSCKGEKNSYTTMAAQKKKKKKKNRARVEWLSSPSPPPFLHGV